MYRIYMDCCCYNRPFDDLTQQRTKLEAEAVNKILTYCAFGEFYLFSSNILQWEFSKIKDIDKRNRILKSQYSAQNVFVLNKYDKTVAKYAQQYGIKETDSYHFAIAENHSADVLLTVDDRFIKAAARFLHNVNVINPYDWFKEVRGYD